MTVITKVEMLMGFEWGYDGRTERSIETIIGIIMGNMKGSFMYMLFTYVYNIHIYIERERYD